MTAVWRSGLIREIEGLGGYASGRVIAKPGPSDEVVPARSFLDGDTLRKAVYRSMTPSTSVVGSGSPGSDPTPAPPEDVARRVAVSRFTRHYSASLSLVALVGLANGLGLDMSIDRCTLIIRHNLPWCFVLDMPDEDVLRCVERVASWQVPGPTVTLDELREHVWRSLYANNLRLVFERLADIEASPLTVQWTNAAEWVALISQFGIEYFDPNSADPIVAECAAVFEEPSLPGFPVGVNPLRDKIEWVAGDGKGFPDLVTTRTSCCLTYLLADRAGRLCMTCPHLPVADRIGLVRERHGVPMGTPGGAAAQRAAEVGLARPSARQVLKLDQ